MAPCVNGKLDATEQDVGSLTRTLHMLRLQAHLQTSLALDDPSGTPELLLHPLCVLWSLYFKCLGFDIYLLYFRCLGVDVCVLYFLNIRRDESVDVDELLCVNIRRDKSVYINGLLCVNMR